MVAADTVVEGYAYDPGVYPPAVWRGKLTIYNSDWSATVTWANSKRNEILYCGYRYDPETGFYHVRNRMYHPTLGRWLQRDPGEYQDGMNLYQYVDSAPVEKLDPQGTIIVLLAGWGKPASKLEALRVAIHNKLASKLWKYELGPQMATCDVVVSGGGLTGQYEQELWKLYRAYLKRKRNIDPNCNLEQFVAIGHSSGASAIYNELWAGTFKAIKGAKTWIKIRPAYLGLIEMGLYEQPTWPIAPDLTGKVPSLTRVEHWKLYTTRAIKGIENFNVPWWQWETHTGIPGNAQVVQSMSEAAAASYETHVRIQSAGDLKWDTGRGTKKCW